MLWYILPHKFSGSAKGISCPVSLEVNTLMLVLSRNNWTEFSLFRHFCSPQSRDIGLREAHHCSLLSLNTSVICIWGLVICLVHHSPGSLLDRINIWYLWVYSRVTEKNLRGSRWHRSWTATKWPNPRHRSGSSSSSSSPCSRQWQR